jgi:hypothetical protein
MRKFAIWIIAFVVVFLFGFVPQYREVRAVRQDLRSCNAGMDLARVRQSAALTYIAATQLNYGVASGYAQQFFNDAQKLAASTSDNTFRTLMGEVLANRDKITADLAKGDSAVMAELQPLVIKVEQGQQ